MASIVGFLEGIGGSAALRYATHAELREALAHAMVDPRAQSAILANDAAALATIAGCRVIAHKVITLPDDPGTPDTPDAPGKDDDKEGDDAPARKDASDRIGRVDAGVTG
ncbi:MAG: hypothetical protein JSR34_03720 [Proteobacteria bacterium]|nr:hypothetical protein [Pseudomonadota bacterium]